MKELKSKIAFVLVCVILGIIIAIQFKTVNETVGSGILPTKSAQQLTLELKKLKDEKEKLLEELNSLESKVKQYEKNAAEENVYIKNLMKELQRYRMFGGYEPVKGPGIIVVVNDPPIEVQFGDDTSIIVNNYDFLLEIVSNLNAAGAEAISINEQRYTGFTEIVPAGNHLEINGVSYGPPFIIKAIGEPKILESALRLKGGVIWYMENVFNLDVQIKEEKEIEIPRYTRINEFKYAKPIEDVTD
ncbi:division initiation protein [Caloranaerobacter azorensis H53214]|uniref:Uncharacterized conserved protein YlxW, UPF0749 family n=2 Tax=Caloranaerobacter azorensis TaxID=116090 RepID=A0A1M5U2H0_9FIRM|nr:DUF881 domain-containing protein [Caloranaerobacter azorensis]KGG80571.1 division initiation protein [Caloranaerobacter azorensis H53214]SHH57046.1 Uncharacterized conserved protein YlxW, UPF0749 family [Caloranaerobacter azorensis DSM 13643]